MDGQLTAMLNSLNLVMLLLTKAETIQKKIVFAKAEIKLFIIPVSS